MQRSGFLPSQPDMNLRTGILLCVLFILSSQANAQQPTTCTTLGQNPATAFPVCGTNVFSQTQVPLCGNRVVPSPACTTYPLTDVNPFWYKFTAFTSGTLGFQITPLDINEDYDWQLFDVTGKSPNDVYTNSSLVVASNWSGEGGLTGASAAGSKVNVCEGPGQPLFSSMPNVIKDHDYLLLISHFTNSQSGYKLSFGGGSASITDTKIPKLDKAASTCQGLQIGVKLNKKMKCSSLAANGSDFTISTGAATIVKASAANCTSGFEMDSIVIELSNSIAPGTYTLTMKDGGDANTLLDVCDTRMAVGEKIDFLVEPVAPTPMDFISTVGCAPTTIEILFTKPILCNSIATNGSDFRIAGPDNVTITGAAGACTGGTTTKISLKLSKAIEKAGTYTVELFSGSDGNTVLNSCNVPTPAGSKLTFNASDTVSAAFTHNIRFGCTVDDVDYAHDGRNGVNSWRWTLDNAIISTEQNPTHSYTKFGDKPITLIVSNGVCRDTVTTTVKLDNEINAAFDFPPIICPQEPATFVDKSSGKINSWNWDFGNGLKSTIQNPTPQPFTIPPNTREVKYSARLIVGNALGCFDTATVNLKAVSSCYITVPSGFSPNNDGLNDNLYPLNAFKATALVFKVFNRYGQMVFETNDWTKSWDGTVNGKTQGAGVYVWMLTYTESDTGKKITKRGTSVLIR